MNQFPTSMFGLRMSHSWAGVFVLDRALTATEPRSIIELGTGAGTLSIVLGVYARVHECVFGTLDIVEPGNIHRLDAICPGAFHKRDALSADTVAWALARFPKPWLLYDDCGDATQKQQALDLWVPACKPGDVLGCHDIHPAMSKKEAAGWMVCLGKLEHPHGTLCPEPGLTALASTHGAAQRWWTIHARADS